MQRKVGKEWSPVHFELVVLPWVFGLNIANFGNSPANRGGGIRSLEVRIHAECSLGRSAPLTGPRCVPHTKRTRQTAKFGKFVLVFYGVFVHRGGG